MLQYLFNYGAKTEIDPNEINLNYEIDITDITTLESQINQVRKTYRDLITLYDSLQNEYLSKKSMLSKKNRDLHVDNPKRQDRIDATAKDIEHSELSDSIEAIKESMKIVNSQLDFVKSDIRILTNSMYRKF